MTMSWRSAVSRIRSSGAVLALSLPSVWKLLTARGESLAAFDGRCIPAPPQRGCRVGDPGLAALLLAQILPVFSVVAPCHRGASPVSVRRQTFTTGCWARRRLRQVQPRANDASPDLALPGSRLT